MAQAKITQEDLTEAQSQLEALTARIAGTTDPAELKRLADEVQRAAHGLEELVLSWRAQLRAAAGLESDVDSKLAGGVSTVTLTDRQRQLVMEETGLTLNEIDLRGPVWPITLPSVSPREIDHAILNVAREIAAAKHATTAATATIDEILNGDNEPLKEQLTKALEDPDFLAGAGSR